MAIQWFEDDCPECGAENWVYDGDPEDLTAADCGPLVKCHRCGHIWDMSGDADAEDMDEDDANEGEPNPQHGAWEAMKAARAVLTAEDLSAADRKRTRRVQDAIRKLDEVLGLRPEP